MLLIEAQTDFLPEWLLLWFFQECIFIDDSDNEHISLLTVCCSLSDSKEEAAAIETELLRDYRFGQQQLIEIWGQACAIAITKVCTPSILHVCVSLLPCCPYFIVKMKQNTS